MPEVLKFEDYCKTFGLEKSSQEAKTRYDIYCSNMNAQPISDQIKNTGAKPIFD